MDLSVNKKGMITIVKPLGKNLDATVSTEFKGRIVDLIVQDNKLFLLDLSNVEFLDSSGLGALISTLKNITLQNGKIVLLGLQKPVVSLFNITRMTNVFKIVDHENDGITLLKKE